MSLIRHSRLGRIAVLVAVPAALSLVAAPLEATAGPPSAGAPVASGSWLSYGRDLSNTRTSAAESTINAGNAGQLQLKFSYATHGDVSATPTVDRGAVYFPDWGGYLHKIDAKTGQRIWSRKISDYTGNPASVSRTSPTLDPRDGLMFVTDYTEANLMAVEMATGALRWKTRVDRQYMSVLTHAPAFYDGLLFQGVSSRESENAPDPSHECCVFRGNVNEIDARTGKIIWKRYLVPDNGGKPGGYSGAPSWGAPAIDPRSRTVYFSSGQNYDVPDSVSDCQEAGGTPAGCTSPKDHVDSVLAYGFDGRLRWASGARIFDAWNAACVPGLPPDNCPRDPGYDYDFGDGAHLFTITVGGRRRQVVGAGQKSGQYWLMDAATGKVIWSAAPGPGGHIGGIMWGTAFDGRRIYLAEANFNREPYRLADGSTSSKSSYAALDPATGKVLWQVEDPADGFAWAPLTVAADVLFGANTSGDMYALDTRTGRRLWHFQAPYSSNAGPSVVDGTVYWGNGYLRFGQGAGTTGSYTSGTLYAFSIGGR